jgi:hypothetical protein
MWFDVSSVTLGQIQASGKRIAIYADDTTRPANLPNYSKIKPEKIDSLMGKPPAQHEAYEFISSSCWFLDSRWHDKDNAKQILKCNLNNLDAKKDNRKVWLISQFNMTLSKSPFDILTYIVGTNSNRLDHTVKQMLHEKKLLYFFRDNADKKWNYMWFDYINKYPHGLCFLQGLNFSSCAKL